MTAPTDPIAEIRQLAQGVAKLAHHAVDQRWLVKVETALHAYADLLAQPRARTCETCVFGGVVDSDRYFAATAGYEQIIGARNCHRWGWVPDKLADGQPFTCAGWTAREQEPRT